MLPTSIVVWLERLASSSEIPPKTTSSLRSSTVDASSAPADPAARSANAIRNGRVVNRVKFMASP
jgi:hypothetical protein